jgi:hypothetical protein
MSGMTLRHGLVRYYPLNSDRDVADSPASELAQYLTRSLRKETGNTDDQTLPAPLVEDIKSWILRHQVTGRAFLKGPETWT